MKKQILKIALIVITIFSSFFSYASDNEVDIVNLNNEELVFIINRADDNTFHDYYIFQYENSDFSFLNDHESFSLVEATSESIIINIDGINHTFGIETSSDNNFHSGYGVVHQTGEFKLIPNLNEGNIDNLIVMAAGPGAAAGVSISCTDGGPGATSCSVSSSVASITTSCSVSCGGNTYACCDSQRIKCRCKLNSSSNSSGTGTIILVNTTISYHYSN